MSTGQSKGLQSGDLVCLFGDGVALRGLRRSAVLGAQPDRI
jgi:hypothetical protein